LEQVFAFLSAQLMTREVLIVENGSNDRTLEIAQSFAQQKDNYTFYRKSNAAKANAVRRGMLDARGDIVSSAMLIFPCLLKRSQNLFRRVE